MTRVATTAAGILLLAAACTGEIVNDRAGSPQPASGTSPATSPRTPEAAPMPGAMLPRTLPSPTSCATAATRGAARDSVRRLTREELRATLADLLPGTLQVSADIDELQDRVYVDDVNAFDQLYTEAQISQWWSVADKVGGLVASDAKVRAGVGSDPCLGSATITSACWQAVLRGFLRRAFRRPVTDEEVDLYAGAVASKDAATGLQSAVGRILMAPDFLFHVESGGAAEPQRVRLTDHEVGNRISYGVVGTMPDVALAAAADAGQLKTLAQIETQVRRLLETPRAKQKVQRFFAEWVHVEGIAAPDIVLYTQWAKLPSDPKNAKTTLRKDVLDFIDAVVLKEKGTFHELLSKRASYTQSSMLAAIYKTTPAATPGAPYATPDHVGLLFRAGFMVGSDENTHPINRGVRFLKRVMCEELPSPDPALIAMRDDEIGNLDPLTMPSYKRVEVITRPEICQTCHAKINPVGFLLESYDQVGRKRMEETYFDTVKDVVKPVATHPLPGPVSGLNIGAGLPTTFQGPTELAEAAAKSNVVQTCMSAFLVRHRDRRRETPLDHCTMNEVTTALQQDQPVLEAFVKSVANEDIFWRGL